MNKSFYVGLASLIFSSIVSAQLQSSIRTIVPGNLEKKDSVLYCEFGNKNTAIPHFPAYTYSESSIVNDKLVLTEKAWPTATADVHAKLPNTSTEIATMSYSVSASILAIFGAEKYNKSAAIDYVKYRIEPLRDEKGNVFGFGRVGVGMRIIIKTDDAIVGFNGTMTSLAFAVKGKADKGTISAELIGISSPDVGMAMPFTADLSEAAVQRVIEAMAVVKSKMFDDKTVIQPQLLSRVECEAPKK